MNEIGPQSLNRRWLTIAVAIWVGYGLVVAGFVLFDKVRTTTSSYRAGSLAWIQSEPLYEHGGTGFIYLPQSAIGYIPFLWGPTWFTEIGWRWFNMATLAVGIWRFARCFQPPDREWAFLGMSWVTLLLGWLMIRGGQATPAMAGLLLLVAESAYGRRTWETAGWLVLGLTVKPLMFVPWLLLVAVRPEFRRPLVVGLVLFAIAPFAAQHPRYVAEQYVGCWGMLHDAHDLGLNMEWPQLFSLIYGLSGWRLPKAGETLVRMLAAMATLAVYWRCHQRLPRWQATEYFVGLTVIYLLLFNPRTEFNTYGLIGPSLAFAHLRAFQRRDWATGTGCVLICIAVMCHYEVGKFIQRGGTQTILAPAGCLLFAMMMLWQIRRDLLAAQQLGYAASGEAQASGSSAPHQAA